MHTRTRTHTQTHQLLALSVEANLRPKLRFLTAEAGVPAGRVGHVVRELRVKCAMP